MECLIAWLHLNPRKDIVIADLFVTEPHRDLLLEDGKLLLHLWVDVPLCISQVSPRNRRTNLISIICEHDPCIVRLLSEHVPGLYE